MLACHRGSFGENCADECFDTCNDCNGATGLCEYGCLPGWTGYFCQKGHFNFTHVLIGIFYQWFIVCNYKIPLKLCTVNFKGGSWKVKINEEWNTDFSFNRTILIIHYKCIRNIKCTIKWILNLVMKILHIIFHVSQENLIVGQFGVMPLFSI